MAGNDRRLALKKGVFTVSAALPATMAAVEIKVPGGPEALVPTTRPVPTPKPAEVLIKVAFAGINGPDIMQRKGLYPAPKGASDLPGLEISGTIVAVGDQVKGWKIGDPICALTNGGGYAEFCTVVATHCLPVPKGFSPLEAAAVPETFFTVWSNVFMKAGLKAGENFLVHGGAGGIGTTAIQLGHAFGAKVFTTDSPASRVDILKKLGADRVIDYATEDFVEVVKTGTPSGGADVILDIVGGDYIQRNIKAMALDGRMIHLAFNKGSTGEINLMPVMLKRLTLTGSTLRSRSDAQKTEIAAELKAKVWPLLDAGTIKPVIHTTLPLKDAAEAHRLMESAKHIGKIMLAA